MHEHFAGTPASRLQGQPRDLLVASPAAGKDLSILLPSGYRYRLLSLVATFTAAAAVFTRQPSLVVTDGDGLVRYRTPWPGSLKTGATGVYCAGQGASAIGEETAAAFSIEPPAFLIPAGWSIGTLTHELQATDQWSGVRVFWEELSDTYPGTAAGHPDHSHLEIDLEVGARA